MKNLRKFGGFRGCKKDCELTILSFKQKRNAFLKAILWKWQTKYPLVFLSSFTLTSFPKECLPEMKY